MANTLFIQQHHLQLQPGVNNALVILGPVGSEEISPYLDPILQDLTTRELFFSLVDQHGLVVCKNLLIHPSPYRRVGGTRQKGRLSQGEFYHHDGCSSLVNARVVEIRCPPQRVLRTMSTAVAPFPEVVEVMMNTLPPQLRRVEGLEELFAEAEQGNSLKPWHVLQGLINRVIRSLKAEPARAYFQAVDEAIGAYVEPWTFSESRFIANNNPTKTVQHRRACHLPYVQGTANGHLNKRWPAEELVIPYGTRPQTCSNEDACLEGSEL